MCIAIYKPEGVIIEESTLRMCFANNDDGAGFAVIEKEEDGSGVDCINTYKGMFSIESFLKNFDPYKNKQALIHFRVATHKVVNGTNCHPWRVNDQLAFIHNGTINGITKDESLSDTGNFGKEILAPLANTCSDFWKTAQFKWLIETAIGTGNKLVLMDVKGDFAIFNEKLGEWSGGAWFSNTTHREKRQFANTSYGYGHYLGDEYEGEFTDVTSGVSSSSTSSVSTTVSPSITDEETKALDLDEVDSILEQLQEEAASINK